MKPDKMDEMLKIGADMLARAEGNTRAALRMRCLELATSYQSSPERTVAVAKEFEAYVTGSTAPATTAYQRGRSTRKAKSAHRTH